MNLQVFLLSLAVVAASTLIPFQAIVNGRLGIALENPFFAAWISFLGGSITLTFLTLIYSFGLPEWPTGKPMPWYLFTGGLIGTVFVTTVLVVVPKIGTANVVAATVLGQLAMSVIIDHYGIAGVLQRPTGPARIVGCLLLLAGVFLIQYEWKKQPAAKASLQKTSQETQSERITPARD